MTSTSPPVLDAVYGSADALSSNLILIVVGFIALLLGCLAAFLKNKK